MAIPMITTITDTTMDMIIMAMTMGTIMAIRTAMLEAARIITNMVRVPTTSIITVRCLKRFA